MRRYPLFDPPEYVTWAPDAELLREYAARIDSDPARSAVIRALSEDQLLDLYAGMVRFRLHDYALKRWVRQGVISKAWLGTGEEAVTVGNVHALERGTDVVAPMIRNAGACHELGMSIEAMMSGYLGTADGPNGGFDLHIGDLAKGVLQPISHVGEMVPVITGVALAFKRRGERRVGLTWIGDGSTKTGAVHEGLNLAAVLAVPAIFVVQNNQVALGTRLDQHQRGDMNTWGSMYGLPQVFADGNNVLDVYAATKLAADRARAGEGPTLLLADTFRMGGHATHDEAEARATFPAELFAYWGRRDPIGLYEEFLAAQGISREQLGSIENDVSSSVDAAAERAADGRAERMPVADQVFANDGPRQPGLAARLAAMEGR